MVVEPGRRDHGRPALGPGKAEDVLLARREEVVGHDEQDRVLPAPATVRGLEAGQQGGRAVLPAEQVEPGQEQPVRLDDAALHAEDPLDQPLDRALEPLRRTVIPIEGKTHSNSVTGQSIKQIERAVGAYVGAHYRSAVEVGIGRNTTAAETARATGCRVRAVDVRPCNTGSVPFARDDVFAPDFALYRGAEVIYVVRPGVEMVPALVALARACACDLLVYHLGNEIYLDGGERIAAGGVVLHRYYRAPSEEG